MDVWLAEVKRVMQARGISPTELSRMSGCGRSHIYRMLSDNGQNISLSKAMDISNALDISLEITPNKMSLHCLNYSLE